MPNIIKKPEEDKIGIDSLKIRIPIDAIKIIDQSLLNYWAEIETATGEIDAATYKLRAKSIELHGIKTKYLICRGNKIMQECVAILFNSKLLKSEYLEGINLKNIKNIYNELMAQQIIYISFEGLLKGVCSDVDIKQDVVLPGGLEGQREAFKFLRELTLPSVNKRSGHDTKFQEKNCGIQWSKREVSSHSYPYIKAYAKDIELLYNSSEFFKTYIKSVPEGLTRIEGTVKNRKHFNSLYFNKNEFTLKNLLSQSFKTHLTALQIMTQKHLDLKIKKTPKKTMEELGWSLNNAFASCLLEEIGSLNLAIDRLSAHTKNKFQQYQGAKKLREIWHGNHYEITKPKHHKSIDKLLTVLGVGEI